MHLESGCGSKQVEISSNLESLLLTLLCHNPSTLPQLWRDGSRLPMWIDMACINQADASEKAFQIPLMRRIYSQSELVLIWINESNSMLRYAFHYLQRLCKAQTEDGTGELSKLFDPIGWDALKCLLECEWFSRRWVVQEAAIPKNAAFLCGSLVMPMEDLFAGIDVASRALVAQPREIKKLKFATLGAVRPIEVLKDLRFTLANGKNPSLLWLLENLRNTHATVAHDQIYGLLGLCSPEEAGGNPIRYDLEAHEVYKTAVETHARLYNDLEFLGLCTPVQREGDDRDQSFKGPSWVPDWHSPQLRRCLGFAKTDGEVHSFNAPGSMTPKFAIKGNDMEVLGVLVDTIEVLGDFVHLDRRDEVSDPNSKLFEQYFDFWMKSTPSHENEDVLTDRAESFVRTLSLLGVYLDPVPSPDAVLAMFYRWCSGSTLGQKLAEDFGFGRRGKHRQDVGRTFMRMKRLLSWQPFNSKGGLMGLAREKCSVGDEIWIIPGCSVPLILSPKKEDQGKREVRGECFLDGFMLGEITTKGASMGLQSEPVILV